MKNRTDIQALRGLAILLVLLYHAKIGLFSAGYLGVDIFFVISGFLITGLVKASIERRDFRFSEFYFRRAKRLLPAAYVTFLVTALLAPFFLGSRELGDFAVQMLGAVTFTGNIVLWQQTGYFEGAGELKPLLHVWSLAIEEQYYLILPATLVFVSPRRWLPLAWIVLSVSLTLWTIGAYWKPVATFYLLPTRAWELAVGSIGALISNDSRLHRLARVLSLPALFALVAIPSLPISGNHPGWDAIVVCLATLIVILRNHSLLNFTGPARMLAAVGDFSYSLYLVHWPIFAFANNAWAGDPPGALPFGVRIVALILSLILAYSLYRYVEAPLRKADLRPSTRLLTKTVAASLGLVLITTSMARFTPGNTDLAFVRRVNYGFDEACAFGSRFVAKPECRNSEEPAILVWGDSYAMHLVPGIVATSGTKGVIQATRGVCGPILDIAPIPMEGVLGKGYNRKWAESCIEFNQSVVEYLAAAPSIEVVVLSSPFTQYLEPSQFRSLARREGGFSLGDVSLEVAIAGIRRTAHAIRALGKRVVVVAPPPAGSFNIGTCLERRSEGKLLFGAPQNCEIQVAEYHRVRLRVLEFLSRLPGEAGVNVFSFDPLLCDGTTCKTTIDGIFVYNDGGHFSYSGSEVIAERASLASVVQALAR